MPNTDKIMIGNVSFYSSDVKDSKVTYKNGEKMNCVFLKNGTKLEFKDQTSDSKPSVQMGYDSGNNNKYGTGFVGINNINIENGGNDEVRIHNKMKDFNGTINADQGDKVTFSKNSKYINMSEGLFTR